MRKNVLFITIGGSCEPIVTTINSLKPDFIYFICSSDIGESKGSYSSVIGEGLVCGPFGKPNKPNIVSQCELNTEQYQIVKLSDCDDHNKCYSECYGLLQTASIRFPDADLIIDYTGGTKSMSGGVLLAATDFEDVIVCLAKGARKDLAKVVDGTERNIRTRLNVPLLKKRIGAIHDLIRRYEYQAAESQIENVFLVPDLPENILIELGVLEKFCKCLNEWDKFNHSIAADIAKTNNCLDSQLLMQLQNVINSRRCIEEGKPIPITDLFSRYEVIFDLIKNAERKAIQSMKMQPVGFTEQQNYWHRQD